MAEPTSELAARIAARHETEPYLDRDGFPQTGRHIVARARERGAPPEVLARLTELNPEQEFHRIDKLWLALGYEATERH